MADSDYMPDDAASFYQQLEGLLDSGWEIRKKYDALRDVFRRAVNQEISLTNLNFSGTFAKLDYLIKKKYPITVFTHEWAIMDDEQKIWSNFEQVFEGLNHIERKIRFF